MSSFISTLNIDIGQQIFHQIHIELSRNCKSLLFKETSKKTPRNLNLECVMVFVSEFKSTCLYAIYIKATFKAIDFNC